MIAELLEMMLDYFAALAKAGAQRLSPAD